MSLLDFLKKKKSQLIEAEQRTSEKKEEKNINYEDNIEIVIENSHNLFENEQETIKEGARTLLENGNVDSFEEGIIAFATIVRGLRYKTTEKEENGKKKIILKDIDLENSIPKKL